MNTLVVNFSYQPVQMVGWQKAIYLICTDKAESILDYDQIVRSVSHSINLPKVVRLKRYVKLKMKNRSLYRKREVFVRDNWTCMYCRKPVSANTATIDHVMPRAQGGKDTYENTVTACSNCNSKKGNQTPKQAGMKLVHAPFKPKQNGGVRGDIWRMFEACMTELSNME